MYTKAGMVMLVNLYRTTQAMKWRPVSTGRLDFDRGEKTEWLGVDCQCNI